MTDNVSDIVWLSWIQERSNTKTYESIGFRKVLVHQGVVNKYIYTVYVSNKETEKLNNKILG